MDGSIESWGIRSAPKGMTLILWSRGTDMVSGVYTGPLRIMGTAETGEEFRYKNGGSEGETLGHHLLFPGFQMTWDKNPETCFLWRPTSWISMLFSFLCSWAWPLTPLVLAIPCTSACDHRGKKGLKFCHFSALQAMWLAWAALSQRGLLLLICTKAPHGLVWPCSWVSLLGQSSHSGQPEQ